MSKEHQIGQVIPQENLNLQTRLSPEEQAELIRLLQKSGHPQGHGVAIQVTQTVTTTSPVPPAELLAGYNQHIPDGANRLFTMVEEQSKHRREIEKSVIETQNKATLRGQWIALGLVALLIGVAVYFAFLGYAYLCWAILTTTIGRVLAVFVLGKKAQENSLREKNPQDSSPQ